MAADSKECSGTYSGTKAARRCRIAADRLKHSADPVTEIAYSCGFSGPSYFGKIFRQEMGCSPSEYRKQLTL